MAKILDSQPWTAPQRHCLERNGKQFLENTLVDAESLDQGVFKQHGGYKRLDKMFDGEIANVLEQIAGEIWRAAA